MPKANDRWMGFIAVRNDLIIGFEETKDGGNDDVERDNNMIGLLGSPLEVMLCPYLNGGGKREGEGYDGFVVGKME